MITSKIGRYEIKSEIAQGGMATVYHAYDPSFERDVAIKVLPQAFLFDPQFRVRFEREAKMIALLEHPAIVPVYDFGEEDGQPYIVMRYMSGGSLTERLKQAPLSIAETAQLISRLAPALDAAHKRNIIHRDLKPGNILFDQYGNAHISDFGIARVTQTGGATLTGTAILGTPAYMSPEQIQGDKDIDGRSDVYALGVLIFQMLTGQAPYQADTPGRVMMMHVLQPVPNILESKDDLPPGCAPLITKAMAKDPQDRYTTAGELASALEKLARGKPTAPLSSTDQAGATLKQSIQEHQMPTAIAAQQAAVAAQKTAIAGQKAASAEQETAIAQHRAAEAAHPTVASVPKSAITPPEEVQLLTPSPSRAVKIWIPVLVILILSALLIAGLFYSGRRGVGPLAFMAPVTSTPTATPPQTTSTHASSAGGSAPLSLPPTATLAPTLPPTETPLIPTPTEPFTPTPAAPVIGGADKIAYISGGEIWVANLDGSGLTQLTQDGASKSKLQWATDGQAVNYISGKCAYAARLDGSGIDLLTCFNFIEYFKAFEISPDGKKVAASLDNQLYILPNDQQKLNSIKSRTDLTTVADCKEFAPYLKNYVKIPYWSTDGLRMAMIIFGVSREIGSADTVQVIPVDQCVARPRALDNFPPPRYTPPEYATSPMIQTLGWDGMNLFAHVTYMRNDGFGNLYIYNMELHKADEAVNPIDGDCCYRDPQFSPDGQQLLFAFQKQSAGDDSIVFYLIPFGTIGTGATYTPLPLPPITNPKEQPQAVLRPVR